MFGTRNAKTAATLLVGIFIVGTLAAPASARSALEDAQLLRARLSRATATTLGRYHDTELPLRRAIERADRQLTHAPSTRDPLFARWREARKQIGAERRKALKRLRVLERARTRRLSSLQKRRSVVNAWMATYGIFRVCPVQGWHVVTDNFGVMVRKPDVPVHVHQGNDITAEYGTPIVAPFAGTAVTAPNVLGGMAVKVYGATGYVYNAHLSRYGKLGAVEAGDVIGYVGVSGDAGGPHDHFEWHPGGGSAVDPYPYLAVSC